MVLNFQNRIALFFAGLFVAIQTLTIVSVYQVSRDNLIRQLTQNLVYAEQVFQRLLLERGERMAGETRILVADFGFRSTLAGSDAKTIASALENLALRIRAQRAFFIDLKGMIVADTQNSLRDSGFVFPDALAEAEINGKAVVFGVLDDTLYEWAIVPVLGPLPIGWVAIAQQVDQRRVEQFKQLSPLPLDISMVELNAGQSRILTSSLPVNVQHQLRKQLLNADFVHNRPGAAMASGEFDYISRIQPLPSAAIAPMIVAVLQIDFNSAQAPYWPLFNATAGLMLLGLLLALAGSALIAHNVSRPVRALAGATERMLQGDANTQIPVNSNDEFGRLAETFNRAAALAVQLSDLQKRDQQRREWVATVSHDLRTPLTSLYGFLETMQRKADSLPPQEQQQFLQTALRQTEKISRLAQELFELAQLECGETGLNPEHFCLAELLQDVSQKFQLAAQQRQIDLTAELRPELPSADADIGLIERLLTNLIDNALRHTPAGGSIRIKVTFDSERLWISVRDSGIGIAPEYLPTLFDWNSPLSRRARNQGGGFGLLVVDKIARLHGGRIYVDSTLGQGSEFRFDLPTASSLCTKQR